MSGWREKAIRMLKQQEADKPKQQAREEHLKKKRDAANARRIAEHAKKVESLGERFKCHVCNVPASEPFKVIDTPATFSAMNQVQIRAAETHNDWSKPGNLYKCSMCKKWTCYDCMQSGICRYCAEAS